jgi:hypothetical protein
LVVPLHRTITAGAIRTWLYQWLSDASPCVDKDGFENSLDRLKLTGWNYKLFGASPRRYLEAVEFLLGERKTEEAVYLARRHHNLHLAGRIHEEAGFHSEAGRAFRDGGHYQDALCCFILAGDEPGQARVFERMGLLEEAMGIWKKRGNPRETARLQKKADKGEPAGSQLTLFEDREEKLWDTGQNRRRPYLGHRTPTGLPDRTVTLIPGAG